MSGRVGVLLLSFCFTRLIHTQQYAALRPAHEMHRFECPLAVSAKKQDRERGLVFIHINELRLRDYGA
jgi:hypothetical protein